MMPNTIVRRSIAARAQVSERSVRRCYRGERVSPHTASAVRSAASWLDVEVGSVKAGLGLELTDAILVCALCGDHDDLCLCVDGYEPPLSRDDRERQRLAYKAVATVIKPVLRRAGLRYDFESCAAWSRTLGCEPWKVRAQLEAWLDAGWRYRGAIYQALMVGNHTPASATAALQAAGLTVPADHWPSEAQVCALYRGHRPLC